MKKLSAIAILLVAGFAQAADFGHGAPVFTSTNTFSTPVVVSSSLKVLQANTTQFGANTATIHGDLIKSSAAITQGNVNGLSTTTVKNVVSSGLSVTQANVTSGTNVVTTGAIKHSGVTIQQTNGIGGLVTP